MVGYRFFCKLVTTACLVVISTTVFARAGGFDADGLNDDCARCHFGGSYSVSASWTAGGSSWTGSERVNPGSSTAFTYGLTGSGAPGSGISLSVRNSGGARVGTMTSVGTGMISTSLNQHITQSSTQSLTKSYSYTWQAPTTLGTYTTYGCLIPVDGTGFQDSDGPVICQTRAVVVNTLPVAGIDTPSVTESNTTGVTFDVLSNDNDGDGGTQTKSVTGTNTSGITKGVLSNNGGGSFTYKSNSDFETLDNGVNDTTQSFTYTLSDGLSTSTGTVNITVTGVNDAPEAVNDGTPGSPFKTVPEGGTLSPGAGGGLGSGNVRLNDTDDDDTNAQLSTDRTCAGGNVGPFNASSFTLDSGGSYTYTHNGGETTSDSFTYCIKDDNNAVSAIPATVYIGITGVNDRPLANPDPVQTVAEGGIKNNINVVGNDDDDDIGDILTPIITGSVNGTATVNPDKTVNFEHDNSQTLTASFTYQARDDSGDSNNTSTNSVTVNFTVTAINDKPDDPMDDPSIAVNEGASVNFDVLINDTDPEGDALSVDAASLTQPSQGAVTIETDGTLTYQHNGDDVPIVGTTIDTFTYKSNDGEFASTNTATVTVTLTSVNDAPTPNSLDTIVDSITVDEGQTVTDLLDSGDDSVLDNDEDEEGDVFTASVDTSPIRANSFTLDADGTFSYEHDGSENFTDSFTYIADDTMDASAPQIVNIVINPVNDSPIIISTAPATVFVEEAASYSYQVTQTDTDDSSFTYSLGSTGLAGDTPAGDMSISATGLITWTPPRTGIFNAASGTVTVTVTDVDASTAGSNKLSATQIFTVITSPLDTDSDGVADYSDNCPAISNAGQQDNDSDTQYTAVDPSGIPATGDVDPSDTNTGGDDCDLDDDNDGMPDAFEISFGFDKDNAADATLDKDGDGVSNLQEFLDGTDPVVDTVGPVITVPADVTVNSTGYLTDVDIGVAAANDGNEGATSVVIPVVDGTIACAQLGSSSSIIDALRPGAYTITWHACDSKGNLATADQSVIVRPLISTTSGQAVGEGEAARFKVMLNGAVGVNTFVDYTVGGSATPGADHDATNGSITIPAGNTSAFIDINVLNDGSTEFSEDIVLTLSNPVNAALGKVKQHTVLISSFNLPPIADIDVDQDGSAAGSTVYNIAAASTGVVLTANAIDPDGDDFVITYDWSGTDNAIIMNSVNGSTSSTIQFPDPTVLSTLR